MTAFGWAALAVALLFAPMGALAQAKAAAKSGPPLRCAGSFAQGGVVVCKTAPGATVLVDGVVRGAADGDGWFVAGFDRDARPTAQVQVSDADGATTKRTYKIAKRQFSIQRVDGLPQQTVTPTAPEVLAKIERDKGLKSQAIQSRADMAGWRQGFSWPVRGRISGAWGNQRVLNGEPRPPHYGVDVAVPTGTPIAAPAPGVVTLAQSDMHFEGGLVILDHGQGLFTYYLHMSRVDVALGDAVTAGQVLGAVGATGRATGPHLCWRMRWRDRNLDPSLAVDGLAAAKAAFAG